MPKYIVANKSTNNIQIIIPAPIASRRADACFVIAPANSLDILPYAGSLEVCRRIAYLADLKHRNMIKIIEEE